MQQLSSIVPRKKSTHGPMADLLVVDQAIREGRFQRSLALIAAMASILSGLEVSYEHYRGSYSQQIMWTPVFISAAMTVAGVWAALSRRAARTVLPLVSLLTILDGVVGFGFHIRGVARKPGGWRVPVMNVIMGPPIFAPLLFGISGYLGLIASFLRREGDAEDSALPNAPQPKSRLLAFIPRGITHEGVVLTQDIREGRFQRNIAVAAALSALFSGLESLYSHYENNFRYRKLQWSPILLTPLMLVAGLGAVPSKTIARTLLPVASALCLLDGTIGTFFHLRGVLRRPGHLHLPLYNIIYGPPIFAPLLFAASGFMGALASLLRRPQ